jgi:hypothetical protein
MKTRILCGLAAAAAVLALPAQANDWFHHHHADGTSYNSAPSPDGSPIHTAANNPDDQMIADQVADALRSARDLNGATVTVAVNNGRVSLAGTASVSEAARIQSIAKAAAGPGHVVAGSIDAQG